MSAEREVIRPLTAHEVETVGALAGIIWRRHYSGIIESAQIEYMLAERYRPEVLRSELGRSDLWWDVLAIDDALRGFSCCFLTDQPGQLKLDKLYVHPDEQRAGHGERMLQRVLARGRELGCRQLMLAVNKRNLDAIAAYRKWGFAIERAVVKDIGGGFVMDDYIMARPIDH
jgi:GNAT superfamily N-acetyltransferase